MPFFDQGDGAPRSAATPFAVVCQVFEVISGLGGIAFAAFVLTVAYSRLPSYWGTLDILGTYGGVISICTFLLGIFRTDGKRRRTMLVGMFFAFVWFVSILAAGTGRDF